DVCSSDLRKEETTYFDRKWNKATTKTKDTTRVFDVPRDVHDIISGYYLLRTIDFHNKKEGDLIQVPVFLSDEIFNLKVRYAGRDVVKTRFGRIRSEERRVGKE